MYIFATKVTKIHIINAERYHFPYKNTLTCIT